MRHRDELDKELRFTSTNASPTSAAAAVLPIGVALVAAYVPARRASEIDPARVLRES